MDIASPLGIFVAILTFLAASVWGARLNYTLNYRSADLNAFWCAKQVQAENRMGYLQDIAKRYLQVSEDYRLAAVYLTRLAASLICSVAFVGIAAIVALFLNWHFWLFPLLAGSFFAIVSAISLARTWHTTRTIWFLNRLGDKLPGIRASELRRWTFMQELIDETDWLRDSLQEIKLPLPQCETPSKKLLGKMKAAESRAEVYLMALQSLSKAERQAVIARLLEDAQLREDILDIMLTQQRQREP